MDQALRSVHDQLGIPINYERTTRLSPQVTPTDLVSIGTDIYGRPQRLRSDAALAWRSLRESAQAASVEIQLVSAYRSIEYQVEVIERLIRKGESIADILTRVAAPGFSEHQSGRAVDVTSPDTEVLEEEFDQSDAFHWLMQHGSQHSFFLSYPKGNKFGVIYEPWHWCYRPVT